VDTRTANREASQVGLGVIEEKICALARYHAELGIEPPSKVEAKPQDFETQVRAVIDAGVPVLSFIYGIPPSEILDECRQEHWLSNHTRRSLRTRASRLRFHCGIQFRRGWPPWVISSLSCGGGTFISGRETVAAALGLDHTLITRRASVGVIGQKRPTLIQLESATYDWFGLVRMDRNGFDSRWRYHVFIYLRRL
jgi:hypothetical protein